MKIDLASTVFTSIEVGGEVLGYEAVKQKAQYVTLKVPSVNTAAKVVGNTPYGLMYFGALANSRLRHSASN
jgi:hypothetical protein